MSEDQIPKTDDQSILQAFSLFKTAFKALEGHLFLTDKLCTGTRHGWGWLVRALFCYLGIIFVWISYSILLHEFDLYQVAADWELNLSEPTMVENGFLGVIFPLILSIMVTHREVMSYCEAMIVVGIRMGGYSLLIFNFTTLGF